MGTVRFSHNKGDETMCIKRILRLFKTPEERLREEISELKNHIIEEQLRLGEMEFAAIKDGIYETPTNKFIEASIENMLRR